MSLTIALAAMLVTAQAQPPPEALLDNLEDVAKISMFGLEAETRVAELTQAKFPEISKRFARLAVDNKAGGVAYARAMNILANLDPNGAEKAANESDEPVLAYDVLLARAVKLNDRPSFMRLLAAAHENEAYLLTQVDAARLKWKDDPIFMRDLVAQLVNGLPEDFGPMEGNYLFETFRAIGLQRIDATLLRRAIEQVVKTVVNPAFNLPEFQRQTTFRIHGQEVVTKSLPEAALLRALASSSALGDPLPPAWAQRLSGLRLADLSEALKTVGVPAEPMPVPSPANPKVTQLLQEADLATIDKQIADMLPTLEDPARLDAISALWDASLKWPQSIEQEDVARRYISEIERVQSTDSAAARQLRDSGTLIERLDQITRHLGRDPAKWPDRLKSKSLLLRRYVHRVEQALDPGAR